MKGNVDILIIGAGPTGLSAALFLVERGHHARIIEKKVSRDGNSKAFGVNARTLELLTDSGLTERYLANGRKLQRLTLRRNEQSLATLKLDEVEHRFNFMLVQSQADSERLLEEALAERGIEVERGVEAVDLRQEKGYSQVHVLSRGERNTIIADCVLGADGPSSVVRKALNIAYDCDSYEEPWNLYDVELELPLPADEASIFLLNDGGMFVVRLRDNVWRVLGNVTHLLDRLPRGTKVGQIHWESSFGISNCVAKRFSAHPYYLAGDAAHIHSGIGARGMNLGIEDSYVFAELFDAEKLERYDELRRPTVQKVVSEIRRAMGPPRAKTLPGKVVRAAPWVVPIIVSAIRNPAQRWILGLDHQLGVNESPSDFM